MTDPAALTSQDLESLRAALIRVREENVADVESARTTLETLVGDGTASDPSLREEIGNAEYMIDDASTIIAMIDAALKRMQDGSYGVCEGCGTQIPVKRLQLRPYGTRCVACAR